LVVNMGFINSIISLLSLGNDLPSVAPKGCGFEKRMNPPWNDRKSFLASAVLEAPTLWRFVETILLSYNEPFFGCNFTS
jgi:hypothetical protein